MSLINRIKDNLGTIKGQNAVMAKMSIANFCNDVSEQIGSEVNVPAFIKKQNATYGWVPEAQVEQLGNDVEALAVALRSQQISEINRGGYYQFVATEKVKGITGRTEGGDELPEGV